MTDATNATQEILGTATPPQQVPPVETPPVAKESSDGFANLLAAIQNPEGKQKYQTVEAALIGAAKGQDHIQRLEAENAALREATTRSATAEELLQRLGQQKVPDPATPAKPEDVRKLVRAELEQERIETTQQQNRSTVVEALTKRFGDKVNEVLQARAAELGMTLKQIGDLAASSPKAVLNFFPEQKPAPTVRTTVNPLALTPQEGQAQPPANIMCGATTNEVMGFWHALGEEAKQKLGVN